MQIVGQPGRVARPAVTQGRLCSLLLAPLQGWAEMDSMRERLEDLKELRDLVRSLGRWVGAKRVWVGRGGVW
jgi:hypothetical protein